MNQTRMCTIGAALAMVAVLSLGWLLGISPIVSQTSAALSEQDVIDSQIEAQEIVLAGLRDQLENMDELNAELAELQEAVPSNAQVETFIDQITEIAEQTGVSIVTIAAEEPSSFAGVAVAEATAQQAVAGEAPVATAGSLDGRLFTVGVSVGVTGSPAQVLDFTGAVQEGTRLFLGTGVTFVSASGDPGGTLTGFVFVVRGTPVAVEAPTG